MKFAIVSALRGRLVQLVRILGRHPRGRGFEFLTAHHRIQVKQNCLTLQLVKKRERHPGYDNANTANYHAGCCVNLVEDFFVSHYEKARLVRAFLRLLHLFGCCPDFNLLICWFWRIL